MAVFREEHKSDFVVMSRRHLRDLTLTLKAKGLLSLMLSLPENWNYSIRGLAAICREGPEAVGGALRELEAAGYVARRVLRDPGGRILDVEYVIYEHPLAAPEPHPEIPDAAAPDRADAPQYKKEKRRKERSNIHRFSSGEAGGEAAGAEGYRRTRAWLLENLELEALIRRHPARQPELEELAELVVETVCARRKTTRIAGADLPHEAVRSRLCKLTGEHLEFVLEGLAENTTAVRCTKQYLLTALFNAPATMSNAYAARVSHDLAGAG